MQQALLNERCSRSVSHLPPGKVPGVQSLSLLHASFRENGSFGPWNTGGSEGGAGGCNRQLRGTIARGSEQRGGQGPRAVRGARRPQAGGHELQRLGVGGGTAGPKAQRPGHAAVPSAAPGSVGLPGLGASKGGGGVPVRSGLALCGPSGGRRAALEQTTAAMLGGRR